MEVGNHPTPLTSHHIEFQLFPPELHRHVLSLCANGNRNSRSSYIMSRNGVTGSGTELCSENSWGKNLIAAVDCKKHYLKRDKEVILASCTLLWKHHYWNYSCVHREKYMQLNLCRLSGNKLRQHLITVLWYPYEEMISDCRQLLKLERRKKKGKIVCQWKLAKIILKVIHHL